MTKQREALELARDALRYHTEQTRPIMRTQDAIVAIDAALAAPDPQPVAWMCQGDPDCNSAFSWSNGPCNNCGKDRIPLYAAPVAPAQQDDPRLVSYDPVSLRTCTLHYGEHEYGYCLDYTTDPEATAPAREISDTDLKCAIARGWCHPANSSKTMDIDLAMAIEKEIRAVLAAGGK